MEQDKRGQHDVPRDPVLEEAFEAFVNHTRVPRDFQAQVMAQVHKRRARRSSGAWWTQEWSPGWVASAVMGLLGMAMGVVFALWLSTSWVATPQITSQARPQMTWAVGVSQEEWRGLKAVVDTVPEPKLEATIDLQPIDPNKVISGLDHMAATDARPDLISVDNDTLGILAQKELVEDLSPYLRNAALPRDSLFQRLQEKHRIDGRDYSVPFHPNVKLVYYNQDMLNKAKKQPPSTWEELYQLARDLDSLASKDSDSWGRVAIQAHDGKAAAVTVFEWVKTMKGDPLTLKGPETREAFKRLWKLAPYLHPESNNIQFDTANKFLIANKVSVVDNWTYGIKVVMGDYGKKNIKVTRGLPGSVHVLGGDVLAIPTGLPEERKKLAIKLIEQLVSKETQRALAEKLSWAPVRGDVYDDLSVPEEWKEYFQEIREVLWDAGMRPTTPYWDMVQKVLSKALQNVLERDPAREILATEAQIDAHIDDLLRPYVAELQAISINDNPDRCVVVE